MSQTIGYVAEEQARHYLCEQGLTWIASNFSCKLGVIDLIMRDGAYLVFIEVRQRSAKSHGSALESVTRSKQQKLIKTALYYLQVNRLLDKQACRFDVLSLDGAPLQIAWVKNAFGLDY